MAETAKERYARTGDSSAEKPEETNERLRRAREKGQPTKPSPEGKSQQQYESEMDAFRKDDQEWSDATNTTGKNKGREEDGSDVGAGAKTQYHSPGATNVGGYDGGGKDIRDLFQEGEKANNAAQAANRGAMGESLGRMQEDRGEVSPENAQLVAREAASRQQQGLSLDMQRDAAMGNAPSEAAAQTQIGMNDISGGQAGAMGAARGLSALGGVQTTGAAGAGQAAGNLAVQGGMGRSAEVGQAIGMYGTSSGDMRQGDLGRVNQTNQNALANQSMNDSWKLGNAGLAVKQGQLGVAQGQMDDAYYEASKEPMMRQLGYDQEMKAIEAGASSDSAAGKRARANADNDRNRQLAGGAVAGGLTLVGALGGPAGAAAGATAGGMANSYINKRT